MKHTTTFTAVPLTRKTRRPHTQDVHEFVRTKAGKQAMKRVMEAMAEGHTVSMSTRYADDGCEIMNAEIVYDGF